MRLTKYPQSCVIVEHDDGGRVLIDPGNVAMDVFDFGDFGTVDAVLFTHRHADHFDPRAVDAIAQRDLPVFANPDVCSLLDDGATPVADGETFEAAGFQIVAHELPHVEMVDGSPGPPNTGFILDGRLLHPGDAIRIDGVRIDALAVPIAGPSISFRDAYLMVEAVQAATTVPIHYEGFIADPERFAGACTITTVVVLDHGEVVEL